MSVSPQTALKFVLLQEKHLDQIMEVELEAYPEPWTPGMFREEMRSSRSYFCLAFAEGQFVGYGGYWLVLDEAHITSVTVAAHQRGRGYGREQVLHLLESAKEQGARIATLEVRESNNPARHLYDSLGFCSVGLRKGYYSKTNEDAVVMVKELDGRDD